ncbi:dTDP-4-dehydrorhamnose reductase family protein [Shewanella sp. cp20]|uniref:dTDP-4-dehydrorhamnose reductase family protein n=1 Tax=Shewanella sp. cp20 TaxID=1521167 RepID=UPI0005A109FB|nr:SDR family oxidoreductase [Shewanella sp. cp20]KIO36797.1 dTDP-4-dehydrorhamnose reductase [Shewanella sp. cp20]
MLKIMITGATGLLGRALVDRFADEAVTVLACGYSRADAGMHRLDLTDARAVSQFIQTHRPDVILHCAAERRPDVSERDPSAAKALNLAATRQLAKAAEANGAWVCYISTDYVFDGTSPDYGEEAQTNPLNFYGETKRQGELALLDVSGDFAVLRLPILYGPVESIEESAVLVMLKQLATQAPSSQDDWAVRSPTSTLDIASALVKLVARQQRLGDVAGIYHFSGSERMTKYQMLNKMAESLGLSCRHVSPLSSPNDSAQRPEDCSLSMARLNSLAIKSEIDFEQGVKYSLSRSGDALAKIGLAFDMK